MNLFHEAKKVLDKDGKVNPLGPYGRQKLTGREVSTYFRRNPVKDAQIKKAVEVALDLQGAMTVASKEIKKFYGDKILRSKEVQKALKYANESVEYDVRQDLQEVSLGDNMLRKDFPNVWATKDAKLYRALATLINFDGFVDNAKAYKRNPKTYIDGLRKMANNPKKYVKFYGKNFPQYINNPKPGQTYYKMPEALDKEDEKTVKDVIGQLKKAVKAHSGQVKTLTKDLKDSVEQVNEVTDKEINMAKKLSKDMEKVKKGYQQIAKTGDKTLKNTGFNPTYEAILKAQQKVLSLIGELNTMKIMSDRSASRKKDSKGRPIMSSMNEAVENALFTILESPYDKKDVANVKKLEKTLQKALKDVDRTMRGSGLSAPAFSSVRSGINKAIDMIQKFYRVAAKIPMKPMKPGQQPQASISDILKMDMTEGKVLKFTKVKDKSLEKHLKTVTKKVGAKLEKIPGGFAVSDTDMRGFTAVVDFIFDKSIKKNMLDGGGMSDVNMVNEDGIMSYPKKNENKIRPMLMKIAKKHPKVKVSFGTHSKGKFVDDNNINFKGKDQDVDKLFKDIQNNHKNLVKMMETNRPVNENVFDTYRYMSEDAAEIARKSAEMIRKTQAKQRILKLNVDIQKAKAALAKAREADSPQADSLSDKYQQLRKRRDSLEDSLYEGMINLDKARKLPDNIQKQILDLKKEYDRTWDGVFVPMGKEGSSQRKEYERRGKVFKAASKKYKDFLKKHKVATF